jgi:hypothetical protein
MKDVHLETKEANPCSRMYIFGCMMYIIVYNGCTSDPGMKDVHLETKDAHPCSRMYIFGCMMYIPG